MSEDVPSSTPTADAPDPHWAGIVDAALEKILVQRAISNPKPLYFQEPFLDARLKEYLKLKGISSTDQIVPDEFVRWIFPSLVAHRKPLYEEITSEYGYTIDATALGGIEDEQEFVELLASALG